MTWEQKLQALQALGYMSLKMRKPGDWYLSPEHASVHFYHAGMESLFIGNGRTPEAAVTDLWQQVVGLEPGHLISKHTHDKPDDYFRWNEFMWERHETK